MAFDHEELNKRRAERQEEQKFLNQQKKLLKLGVIFTAATLVLCAGALLTTWLVVNRRQEPPTLQTPTTQAPVTTAPPTEPAPTVPDTVIHFVAGGDLNVTDKVVQSGLAVSGFDYTEMFLDVAPILAGGDITSVNFEGSLYGAPYGTANKSAPIQLLQSLQRAGVDLLQAANSQTVVNGLSGMRQTLQGIHSAGLTPLGAFTDEAEFKRTGGFVIREVQGVKIAFVAFTKGMDGMGPKIVHLAAVFFCRPSCTSVSFEEECLYRRAELCKLLLSANRHLVRATVLIENSVHSHHNVVVLLIRNVCTSRETEWLATHYRTDHLN